MYGDLIVHGDNLSAGLRGLFKVEYYHDRSLDKDVETAIMCFLFPSEHKK